MIKHGVIALVAFFAVIASVRADFDDGYRALQMGDYPRAVAELQPVAEDGDPKAQYVLGVMFVQGLGIARQPDLGVTWLRKAALQDHVDAQLELARMYENGDGVPGDDAEMAKWYRRAAAQGDVGAQLFVADLYVRGRGLQRDLVRAYMWYEIAGRYWGDLAAGAKRVVAEQMTPAQIAEAERLARQMLDVTGQ